MVTDSASATASASLPGLGVRRGRGGSYDRPVSMAGSDANPASDLDSGRYEAVGAPDVRALTLASGLGRMAIGAALALAPERALSALGFTDLSPTAIAASRLAGGRDLVLGAAMMAAIDDPERLRAASLANAAVDAGDAATFLAALAHGDEVRTAALRGLAAAVPATIAGLWVALRLR
jgi:hypothetical protein